MINPHSSNKLTYKETSDLFQLSCKELIKYLESRLKDYADFDIWYRFSGNTDFYLSGELKRFEYLSLKFSWVYENKSRREYGTDFDVKFTDDLEALMKDQILLETRTNRTMISFEEIISDHDKAHEENLKEKKKKGKNEVVVDNWKNGLDLI